MKEMLDINKAVEALQQCEISVLEAENKAITYLNKLNTGQQIAATRKEGHYLVIAGPGTGKTHTLVYRVAHLVKTGVDPKKLVVITFTRKAGNELKFRLNTLMPNTSLGFVGTFHAFANHISQMIGSASPISKFRLLDPEDDLQIHHLVLADFSGFNQKIRPKDLQKMLSYCSNTGLSVKDYMTTFDLKKWAEDIDNIERYSKHYAAYKANHMLANYDDMILLISKYLEQEDHYKITAPFDYLMVDEYQDTNQMQLDFIKKLKIENVMAIGDDFQGIYAFRGADHRIILNFFNDFPEAKMIKLTENYRSNKEIIAWVNQSIAPSPLGFMKELIPVREGSGDVRVISGGSLAMHKAFIIDNIKKQPTKGHALIYRYNKNRSVFEKALINENIEYVVYGGIRLLERKHIKDVLAFLMVHLNQLDVVSYNRVLTMLPGIGAKTAKKLMMADMASLSNFKGQKKDDLKQIKELITYKGSKEALYKAVCEFYLSLYEHVSSEYYTREEIIEDLLLVGDILATFDTLENFVINLILDPVIDLNKGKQPKVILTTIHSAKGLEFDNVYYFHMHDWYKNYDLEMLEEDRRLFYVGISRAKENLYIFDHTEVERTFENILRDFSSSINNVALMATTENSTENRDCRENKGSTEHQEYIEHQETSDERENSDADKRLNGEEPIEPERHFKGQDAMPPQKIKPVKDSGQSNVIAFDFKKRRRRE